MRREARLRRFQGNVELVAGIPDVDRFAPEVRRELRRQQRLLQLGFFGRGQGQGAEDLAHEGSL